MSEYCSQDMIDKKDVLGSLSSLDFVAFEFGCGAGKRDKQYIGVDLLDSDAVDIVGDALCVLRRIPESSVDLIVSSHFIEHLNAIDEFLVEAIRVLKKGGELITTVPHHSNSLFYSDPTHRSTFGLYSFSYFFQDEILKRKVPRYVEIKNGLLSSVKLNFRSFRPHYISHAIRSFAGLIFNSSAAAQEIYEESFSSMISCYDITYVVKKC